MDAVELATKMGGIRLSTASDMLSEMSRVPSIPDNGCLTLSNGVSEESYNAHFPEPYNVKALTPWEAKELGLDPSVQQWIFLSEFKYISDKFGEILIPKDFTTDFASVPARLQSIISSCSPLILRPSAPHDWLYTENGLTTQLYDPKTLELLQAQGLLYPGQTYRRLTFEQVNELLCEAMFYCGAGPAIRAAVYEAVQIGGKSTWNAHNPPNAYMA
jgi:hypothetical protein